MSEEGAVPGGDGGPGATAGGPDYCAGVRAGKSFMARPTAA